MPIERHYHSKESKIAPNDLDKIRNFILDTIPQRKGPYTLDLITQGPERKTFNFRPHSASRQVVDFVRFYNYVDPHGRPTDEVKSSHIGWTLKSRGRSVRSSQRPKEEITERLAQALRALYKTYSCDSDYDPEHHVTVIDNEIIVPGAPDSGLQLKFTFLKGRDIHGHVYLEPAAQALGTTA